MQSPQYIGVYSLRNKLQGVSKALYFVWQTDSGDYIVQRIDSARRPVGVPERVARDVLLQNFVPEAPPAPQPVMPQEGENSFINIAKFQDKTELPFLDGPAGGGEPQAPRMPSPPADAAPQDDDAEFRRLELARKAKQVETSMRETFRKTLLRLKRPKERHAALTALEQMAASKEGIMPEHRHMFRDFGVQLRKQAQADTALRFSRRVVKLAPNDDHALFNTARILCDLQKYDEAEQLLAQAMQIDANEPVYRLLRDHIIREKQRNRKTR